MKREVKFHSCLIQSEYAYAARYVPVNSGVICAFGECYPLVVVSVNHSRDDPSTWVYLATSTSPFPDVSHELLALEVALTHAVALSRCGFELVGGEEKHAESDS